MSAAEPTRIDRRKARTRQALVDAARRIIVTRGTDVSIQDITDEADVGFGSFYNHFETKAELFETAVSEVLEEYGARLDSVAEQFDDPAERYAVGVRMTARLASEQPVVAQVVVRSGQEYLISDKGLAPRALRDIELAIAAGRFTVASPYVALVATAGSVLGFLQIRLTHPALLVDEDADELAETLLRSFGVPARSARVASRRPLPPAGA